MLDLRIFDRIIAQYSIARQKHPDFAYGPYHALGYLGEEYGEVSREITKQHPDWQERMDAELIDLIVVALRMLQREYEHEPSD